MLSTRVKERMHDLGLSQLDVVQLSGVKQAALNHICTGRVKMAGALTIFRLASALQCDPKWLATGEEE